MPDLEIIYPAFVGLFIAVKLSGILAEQVDVIKPFEDFSFGLLKAFNTAEGHAKEDWFLQSMQLQCTFHWFFDCFKLYL